MIAQGRPLHNGRHLGPLQDHSKPNPPPKKKKRRRKEATNTHCLNFFLEASIGHALMKQIGENWQCTSTRRCVQGDPHGIWGFLWFPLKETPKPGYPSHAQAAGSSPIPRSGDPRRVVEASYGAPIAMPHKPCIQMIPFQLRPNLGQRVTLS